MGSVLRGYTLALDLMLASHISIRTYSHSWADNEPSDSGRKEDCAVVIGETG